MATSENGHDFRIPSNQKEREWLLSEIQNHEIQTEAAKYDKESVPKEELSKKVSEGLDELFERTMQIEKEELTLKRLERSEAIMKLLFEKPEIGDGDAPMKTQEKEYLEMLMEKQCDLVSDIMKTLKECREYQKELDEVKKSNRDLLVENRLLMAELKTKQENKKKIDDQETERLKSELSNAMQMISITRGLLQGLIIGSGVHWAQDDKLQKIVFTIGETLQI